MQPINGIFKDEFLQMQGMLKAGQSIDQIHDQFMSQKPHLEPLLYIFRACHQNTEEKVRIEIAKLEATKYLCIDQNKNNFIHMACQLSLENELDNKLQRKLCDVIEALIQHAGLDINATNNDQETGLDITLKKTGLNYTITHKLLKLGPNSETAQYTMQFREEDGSPNMEEKFESLLQDTTWMKETPQFTAVQEGNEKLKRTFRDSYNAKHFNSMES